MCVSFKKNGNTRDKFVCTRFCIDISNANRDTTHFVWKLTERKHRDKKQKRNIFEKESSKDTHEKKTDAQKTPCHVATYIYNCFCSFLCISCYFIFVSVIFVQVFTYKAHTGCMCVCVWFCVFRVADVSWNMLTEHEKNSGK